jgi:hypothetical protein
VSTKFGEGRWGIVACRKARSFTVPAIYIAKCGVADADRFLQHAGKYWLKIARRTTDRLKHLRRGRLLLKGLPQFAEQSRVFDGDDGLGGKVCKQGDLLVAKGADLLANQTDPTNEFVGFQHWGRYKRSRAPKFDGGYSLRVPADVSRIDGQIGDMD